MRTTIGYPGALNRAKAYDARFFERLDDRVRASAEAILPVVLGAVRPTSAVDVGCGIGTWLRVLRLMGVEDVVGVDGPHVDRRILQIPPDRFLSRDLEQRLDIGRSFDLAICLEVAEHLSPTVADQFVAELVALAPITLFSAAVPSQGGRQHVNEQWQSWWADKFAGHGRVAVDLVRPAVWDDDRVLPWYAQNCLIFVDGEAAASAGLKSACRPLDVIHPRLWEYAHSPVPSVRSTVSILFREAARMPGLVTDAVRRR